MASLREVRNAIVSDMQADGLSLAEALSYKESFKQAIRVADDQRLLYSRKERVEVVTSLFISFRK